MATPHIRTSVDVFGDPYRRDGRTSLARIVSSLPGLGS